MVNPVSVSLSFPGVVPEMFVTSRSVLAIARPPVVTIYRCSMTAFAALRRVMVEQQIISRGVRAPLVLEAMRTVPREAFLPRSLQEFAYDDSPLPINANQTISQPYIVAFMIEALNLKGGETVLEIGAGSGYAAGVLSRIAGCVYTVERIAQLAEKAATVLAGLHYDNVLVRHGDGTQGWPEYAPYDAIIVAAGGRRCLIH